MRTKLIVDPVTGDLTPVIPSTTNLGNYKHTRGSTPPVNPSKGDTWDQLSLASEFIAEWAWNGTYWLSTQRYTLQGINTVNNLTNSVGDYGSAIFPQGIYSYFIDTHIISGRLIGEPHDANNYWKFVWQLRANGFSTDCAVSSSFNNITGFHNQKVIHLPVKTYFNKNTYNLGFANGIEKIGNPLDLFGYSNQLIIKHVYEGI